MCVFPEEPQDHHEEGGGGLRWPCGASSPLAHQFQREGVWGVGAWVRVHVRTEPFTAAHEMLDPRGQAWSKGAGSSQQDQRPHKSMPFPEGSSGCWTGPGSSVTWKTAPPGRGDTASWNPAGPAGLATVLTPGLETWALCSQVTGGHPRRHGPKPAPVLRPHLVFRGIISVLPSKPAPLPPEDLSPNDALG